MDNEEDKLAIYSFGKASEFYEEKAQKLRYEDIKNCSMVMDTEYKLKIEGENLLYE